MRIYSVSIGGTNWKPEIPNEENVQKELDKLLNIKNTTERAISIMLYLMRTQFFCDGNKRTSMLFANKIMIGNGAGIISIPVEKDVEFGEKLIKYYETNDTDIIKNWIYENCIDGIQYESNEISKS